MAAGLSSEEIIQLPYSHPIICKDYFENEIEATQHFIDEARGKLKTLKEACNLQIRNIFGNYEN
jgi:hypothetical protein